MSAESQHSIPGAQLLQLVDLLTHWNIEPHVLLAGTGLSARTLEEPNVRIPIETMNLLVARARTLTGEPALGIFMGLRRRISMYGFLGFAALTSSTFGEALELAVKFSSTITTAVSLSLHVEAEFAVLRVDERHDPGDVRDIAVFALVIGLEQIGRALTGQPIAAEVYLAIPKPAYAERFSELLARVQYDQPVTQLVFPSSALKLPLTTSDRAGVKLARQQCERALCDLGLDGTFVDRVRALISNRTKGEGVRSLDEVATAMRLSARTLKRRLAAQGARFSDLLDQERCKRASLLLSSSGLSLDDIAERLGYSTLTNFARAFRRWTGLSPLAYRRTHQTITITRMPAPALGRVRMRLAQ